MKANTVDLYLYFISKAYLSDRAGLWMWHCLNGAIINFAGINVSLRCGNLNDSQEMH